MAITESHQFSPTDNHLLAALPSAVLERLRPHLQLVKMESGEVLYEEGARLRHFYFPVSGVVSMLHVTLDGHCAEVALLGNDGCVGMTQLLGGGSTPNRKVVQIPGYANRIPVEFVTAEFDRHVEVRDLLLRYVQGFMTQMATLAVCNRHHHVEQQLCRWLLASLDRVANDEIHMTQELISNMLGVRRTGITHAVTELDKAGVIEHRRGLIRVPDRVKLEARSCECYGVVKKETDRLSLVQRPPARVVAPA